MQKKTFDTVSYLFSISTERLSRVVFKHKLQRNQKAQGYEERMEIFKTEKYQLHSLVAIFPNPCERFGSPTLHIKLCVFSNYSTSQNYSRSESILQRKDIICNSNGSADLCIVGIRGCNFHQWIPPLYR